MKKTVDEKNSVIAALFLFQYSLLIPLMAVINPTLLVAISGILLMGVAFIINRKVYINAKAGIIVGALLLIMILKGIIDGSDTKVFVSFLMISLPSIVVYSYKINTERFLDFCHALSLINFFLLFMIPFLVRRVAYMRFGYGMILTVLFSFMAVFHPKKEHNAFSVSSNPRRNRIINIVVFVVSLIETTIYGNRGVLIIVLSFIAIDALLINNRNKFKNIIFIVFGFLGIFNLDAILEYIINMATKYGIKTYAINKYRYQLRYGLEEASSGRGRLYRRALETIRKHPFFGDKMITYEDGTLYVHNLFLQVGRDMGILIMILSIIFVCYCLFLLFSKKMTVNEKTVVAVFFCVSVVRLMISSNLWERPELWALISIIMNYKSFFVSSVNTETYSTSRIAVGLVDGG